MSDGRMLRVERKCVPFAKNDKWAPRQLLTITRLAAPVSQVSELSEPAAALLVKQVGPVRVVEFF